METRPERTKKKGFALWLNKPEGDKVRTGGPLSHNTEQENYLSSLFVLLLFQNKIPFPRQPPLSDHTEAAGQMKSRHERGTNSERQTGTDFTTTPLFSRLPLCRVKRRGKKKKKTLGVSNGCITAHLCTAVYIKRFYLSFSTQGDLTASKALGRNTGAPEYDRCVNRIF